jgi:hypothetical protein
LDPTLRAVRFLRGGVKTGEKRGRDAREEAAATDSTTGMMLRHGRASLL